MPDAEFQQLDQEILQQEPVIPADIPEIQTVILTDEQFTSLIDGQAAMNNNLFWIACTLIAILGVLLIKSFWDGWRSHK